jgi:putative zinc finger/helix-turn-helix YgiT family protein
MKCLNCKKENFETKKVRFPFEMKGMQLEVIVPAQVCSNCNEPVMDSVQMNVLRKESADEYKKAKGLLTSVEIINFRQKLKMSQSEFARYMNVGEASIKRWETYFIQDESQDEHIRIKCDQELASLNALEVAWKNTPADEKSGNKLFRVDLFANVVLFLLPVFKSPLFLLKALFYVDFLHFRRTDKGITGARYVRLDYGPCPDQYQNLFKHLISKGYIKENGKHDYVQLREPDLKLFDDVEIETLKMVKVFAEKHGEKKLFELSHKEAAFEKTAPFTEMISYKHAKTLLFPNQEQKKERR